jgi:DNA invertase Pin-like site-specific DNA recombinase
MHCYSYARVSSKNQALKHGIARQEKAAKEWADKNGHTLIPLSDKGLSAYSGKHTKKGALGKFIAAVDAGEIPTGSILIVEALDRLSRQDILTQLNQFIGLLTSGIEIVTLSDNMHFTEDSVGNNWMELILSIALMAKANDESKLKGDRIKSARKNSHKLAEDTNHIITKQVPFWCTIVDNKIEPNKHADTVKQIFKLSLAGNGAITIARALNELNVPIYKAAKKSIHDWNSQKVNRILRMPAVYGLFSAVGENNNIENYYPEIIPKDDFFTVQGLIDRRFKTKIRSSTPGNLFTGLLKCKCGANYSYGTSLTGKQEASARYIRCNRRQHGEVCDAPRLWYYPFEKLILSSIAELQFERTPIQADGTIAIKAEIKKLELQNIKLLDLMLEGSGSQAMVQKSKEIEEEIIKLKWDIKLFKHKKAISPNLHYKVEDIENIQSLENSDLRKNVLSQVNSVIENITIQDNHFIVLLTNEHIYKLVPEKKNSAVIKDKKLIKGGRLF